MFVCRIHVQLSHPSVWMEQAARYSRLGQNIVLEQRFILLFFPPFLPSLPSFFPPSSLPPFLPSLSSSLLPSFPPSFLSFFLYVRMYLVVFVPFLRFLFVLFCFCLRHNKRPVYKREYQHRLMFVLQAKNPSLQWFICHGTWPEMSKLLNRDSLNTSSKCCDSTIYQ